LIYENILYVANVGDSAGVVCRNGKAVALTDPHTLKSENERRRIEEAGGVVMDDRLAHPIWNPKLINIGVTRALGDLYFKDEQYTLGKTSGLIATPEIRRFPLTNDDRFIILATDGFWDHISLQESVDYVLKEKGTNAKLICKNLTDLAAKKAGSCLDDNATVLLVKLKGDDEDRCLPLPVPITPSISTSSSNKTFTLPASNSSTSDLANNNGTNEAQAPSSSTSNSKHLISSELSTPEISPDHTPISNSSLEANTLRDETFKTSSSEKLHELAKSLETRVN